MTIDPDLRRRSQPVRASGVWGKGNIAFLVIVAVMAAAWVAFGG